MGRLTGFGIDLGIGYGKWGSYQQFALDQTNFLAHWPLSDLRGTDVLDAGASSHDGDYVNDPQLGTYGPLPEGGPAPTFEAASSQYATMGNNASLRPVHVTLAAWIKPTTVATAIQYVAGCGNMSNNGFLMYLALDEIRFRVGNGSAAAVAFGSFPVVAGEYLHVIGTYDGSTVKLYQNGAFVSSISTISGNIDYTGVTDFMIAQAQALDAGRYFDGQIAQVSMFSQALNITQTAHWYQSGTWTDMTPDVVGDVSISWGTNGNTPLTRLPDAGSTEFFLRNDGGEVGESFGSYSPHSQFCMFGFVTDIPFRMRLTFNGVEHIKGWGRLSVIDPLPGIYMERRTRCVAQDYAFLLGDVNVREIQPQVSQSEDDLIRVVIEAMPNDLKPMALDLNAGLDTFTYAFYDIGGGVKALTALAKPVMSAWGTLMVRGDGTLVYRNRQAESNQLVAFDILETMELEVPINRANIFNNIRVTTHPKELSATNTTQLFLMSDVPSFSPAETKTFWLDYRDPANAVIFAGGFDFQEPVVATTDYLANTLADGSGTDVTGDFTVDVSFFAASAKAVVTNGGAGTAYLTFLQGRGRAIYDLAPVTYEATSGRANRPLNIDLLYQDDANIGQAIADFILNEHEELTLPNQVTSVTIMPEATDTLMETAITCEPGLLVSIYEEMTQILYKPVIVRSVSLDIIPEHFVVRAEIGIRSIVVGEDWILGDPDRSLLGISTILGSV